MESNLKIGLIIDNPVRDLEGLVLVGRELVRRGHKVFLIPMYSQGFEVPALGLDCIVLNYARVANTNLIRAYYKAGIFVCILDTEGGVWENESQFVLSINHSECADIIGRYFLWGPRQKNALELMTKFDSEKLRVTGCPRYDFYHESLIEAIRTPATFSINSILMISNFALSHPRFSTELGEISNMVQSGYEYEYVLQRRDLDLQNRKAMKQLVRKLAADFPKINVVLRVHPFERDEDYVEEFLQLENVHVVRSGSVGAWLKSAAISVHFNSSVAVDAYLMRRPMLTAGWLATDLTKEMATLSYDLSYPAESYNQMKNLIEYELFNKPCSAEIKRPQTAVDLLRSWFFDCDGRAHIRIADEIASARPFFKGVDLKECKKLLRICSNYRSALIGTIDFWGRKFLGAKRFEKIRNEIAWRLFRKGRRPDKNFNSIEVNNILNRLDCVIEDGYAVRARDSISSDYFFSGLAGSSLILELVHKK